MVNIPWTSSSLSISPGHEAPDVVKAVKKGPFVTQDTISITSVETTQAPLTQERTGICLRIEEIGPCPLANLGFRAAQVPLRAFLHRPTFRGCYSMGSGSADAGALTSKAETLMTSVAFGTLPWGNLSIPIPFRGRWKSRIAISQGPTRMDRHVVKEEHGCLYLRKRAFWSPALGVLCCLYDLQQIIYLDVKDLHLHLCIHLYTCMLSPPSKDVLSSATRSCGV